MLVNKLAERGVHLERSAIAAVEHGVLQGKRLFGLPSPETENFSGWLAEELVLYGISKRI